MLRRPRLTALLATLTLLGCAGTALGAAGDPDPTFGTGGSARIDLGLPASAYGMDLRPDGRILLAGIRAAGPGAGTDGVVAQLGADGALDRTFASGTGWTKLDFDQTDRAYDVAVQPDGRLLVVGGSAGQGLVARLSATDGALDPTFGGGTGWARLPIGGAVDLQRLVVQPDGAILGAGISAVGDVDDAVVARIRVPAGDLDPSFAGGSGRTLLDFGAEAVGNDLALQPDGRIVLAGALNDGPKQDLLVARLRAPQGDLDPSFGGGDGWTSVDLGGDDAAAAVAIQPDGRIVAAGSAGRAGGDDILVARFLADGQPDPSFAGDGTATMDLGGVDIGWDVALQPDGRIVVAGLTARDDASPGDMAVARLMPDGTPDASFGGGDGWTARDVGGDDTAYAVSLRPDGRIVLAGDSGVGQDVRFAVAQFQGAPTPPPAATGGGGAAPVQPAARRVLCGGRRATIVGTPGRDRLRGTPRADVIAGLAGDDVISGLGGNDIICGGAGADRLLGGPGADRLIGGAGADQLLGGAGRDRLLGGAGADRLVGGAGVDALLGGAGRNVRTQ
ncbi:MAG: hypothetical protein AB7O78_04465 [Thermoleophilia bacterium]